MSSFYRCSQPARGTHLNEEAPIAPHPIARQIALAAAAAATVVFAASTVQPVFLGRNPVVAPIVHAAAGGSPDAVAVAEPWLYYPTELALRTERFRHDREAFALDLIRTGKVNPVRARSIAQVAVAEAYRQQIPPALVLGVMLTENDELKPTARSKVGAVGLMQIYARHWRDLGRKYGTDLHDDATNLKYGVHILHYMTDRLPGTLAEESAWRKALLGYNGCVRGTNTRDCAGYPDVVRRAVERSARASCAGRDFGSCVVTPLWVAFRDK